jgi:DinB superfamily
MPVSVSSVERSWLADKYDLVLGALEGTVLQLTPEMLSTVYPERKQTLRQHSLHIAAVMEGSYLTHVRGTYTADELVNDHRRFDAPVPQGAADLEQRLASDAHGTAPLGDIYTAQDVSTYIESVRQKVTSFIRGGPSSSLERVVYSHYGGDVPVLRVLGVVLRHGSHHLRQLYWFMETSLHVIPQYRLSDDDWEGIEMPEKLFIPPG